ncbi:MAG TPA: PhnD/SsuA/transferrin family substrate-binding protein [Anaerolineaceae bacterium]|nr:PhnD/SsuA/transferrin family substrate-binding protein [Anaerolineaceae bacterium]
MIERFLIPLPSLLSRLIWSGLLVIALVGCQQKPVQTPSATPPLPTITPLPAIGTSTPTPYPLGSSQNPLILGVVAEGNAADVSSNAETLAAYLSNKTGITIQSQISDNYDQLVRGIDQRNVHLAWLPPLTYIIARRLGIVEIGLMTNHFGVYSYSFQFMANASSGLTSYYDPNTNKNTAGPETALTQLQGKRPCWVNPQSIAGYIAPYGLLNQIGLTLEDGVVVQSYSAAVRALYIQGICDVAAVYGSFGDPRTASAVQKDLPDAMSRVVILWQSDPIIPNLGLSFSSELSTADRQEIIDALQEYVKTDEGKAVLSAANNQYDIQDLRIVDDSFYDGLRDLTESAGVQLYTLIGK